MQTALILRQALATPGFRRERLSRLHLHQTSLPLACTDRSPAVGQGEGEGNQAGDLITGLVSLTDTKQRTGRRGNAGRV